MRKLTIEHCHKAAAAKNGKCLSVKYIHAKTKYIWMCSKGHKWESTYDAIQNLYWCPECSGNKKLTTSFCHNIAKKYRGKFLDSKYINSKTKHLWQCSTGHVFQASLNYIKKDYWCPICAGIIKYTIEDCKSLAESRYGKCLSANYISSKNKLTWQCSSNHQWQASFEHIKEGTWCPECSNNVKLTIDHCHIVAKNKKGKCLSSKYNGAGMKYTWQCEFGHIWEASLSTVKSNWCAACFGNKRKTIKDCHDLAKLRDGKFLSSKYINNGAKYVWQCLREHQWSASFRNISAGTWCPKCKTKTQTYIYNICKELFPNYDIKYNYKGFDWLRHKRKLELDIYIPELKLAIEYDGEQHFKPVCFGGIPIDDAQSNLKSQQKRDDVKNQLINDHMDDISYFVRFGPDEVQSKRAIESKIINILT